MLKIDSCPLNLRFPFELLRCTMNYHLCISLKYLYSSIPTEKQVASQLSIDAEALKYENEKFKIKTTTGKLLHKCSSQLLQER